MTFVEILQKFNIPYRMHGEHHHVSHGWIAIDCPWCSPGWNHFRAGFNLARGHCNCWSCGRLGLGSVLSRLTGLSNSEVSSLIKELPRVAFLPVEARGTLLFPPCDDTPHEAHRKFLQGRGLPQLNILMKLWEIKFTTYKHPLKWRLIIPILYQGTVVSWTSRALGDGHLKRYRAAGAGEEAVPHKWLLYGEDFCRGNSLLVLEGPLDVWAAGPGSVCTFGTGYSRAQVEKISKYPRRVICFDAEPAAQAQAHKLVDELSAFSGETYNVVLESGKDPSRASQGELKELRKRFL